MSAAILRSAICSILDDEGCHLDTPRMRLAKEAAKVILDSIADDHHNGRDKFESFAEKIVGRFEKLVPDPAVPKNKKAFNSKKRHCGAISIRKGYRSFVYFGKITCKAVL